MTIGEILAHIEKAQKEVNTGRHGVPENHPLREEFRHVMDTLEVLWERTNNANTTYKAQI